MTSGATPISLPTLTAPSRSVRPFVNGWMEQCHLRMPVLDHRRSRVDNGPIHVKQKRLKRNAYGWSAEVHPGRGGEVYCHDVLAM